MTSPPRLRTRLQRTAAPNAPPSGSVTITATAASETPSATLRLRAEPDERRRIQWADDVVDNEGMGKKSSKVCCIYHKTHEPADSSSDSDSSSSDDNYSSEPDTSRAQRADGPSPGRPTHHHDDSQRNEEPVDSDIGGAKGNGKARAASPNAYEKVHRAKSKASS